jgi:anti-sigma factor RsiW
MNANLLPSQPCSELDEALERSWADASGPDLLKLEPSLVEHLEACPRCRREADAIREVDARLSSGLGVLVETVPLPSPERIAETIRRVEEASEARLIRRLRRPLRIVLWGAFFAFTLLASSVLALAIYRALRSLAEH